MNSQNLGQKVDDPRVYDNQSGGLCRNLGWDFFEHIEHNSDYADEIVYQCALALTISGDEAGKKATRLDQQRRVQIAMGLFDGEKGPQRIDVLVELVGLGIFLSLGGKDRQGYRDNDDVERIISGFHRRLSEQQHERQAQINDMIGKAVDTLVNAGTLTKDSPVRRLVSPVRVEGIGSLDVLRHHPLLLGLHPGMLPVLCRGPGGWSSLEPYQDIHSAYARMSPSHGAVMFQKLSKRLSAVARVLDGIEYPESAKMDFHQFWDYSESARGRRLPYCEVASETSIRTKDPYFVALNALLRKNMAIPTKDGSRMPNLTEFVSMMFGLYEMIGERYKAHLDVVRRFNHTDRGEMGGKGRNHGKTATPETQDAVWDVFSQAMEQVHRDEPGESDEEAGDEDLLMFDKRDTRVIPFPEHACNILVCRNEGGFWLFEQSIEEQTIVSGTYYLRSQQKKEGKFTVYEQRYTDHYPLVEIGVVDGWVNWRFPDIYTQVERGLPSEPKQTHVGDGEFFLDGVEDARKFARQMKADSNGEIEAQLRKCATQDEDELTMRQLARCAAYDLLAHMATWQTRGCDRNWFTYVFEHMALSDAGLALPPEQQSPKFRIMYPTWVEQCDRLYATGELIDNSDFNGVAIRQNLRISEAMRPYGSLFQKILHRQMRLDIGQIRHPEEMVSPERLLDGLWESGFDEASIIGLQRPVSRGDLEQIRDQREHLFDMIERDFLEFLRLILGEVVNIHDTDDYVELLSSPTDMTALETNTRVILSLLLSADLFIDNDAPRLVEAFVSGYQSELRQHSGYPSLSIATSGTGDEWRCTIEGMGDIPQTIVSQNDFEVQRACHAILCDMYSMNLVWDGKHDFYEYPDEDALAQVVLMVPPRYWRFAFQDFFGSKISPYVRVLRVLVGVLEQEFVAKVDDPVNFEEEHSELLWALGVYDYVSESWSFLFTTDWVDFIIEHAPRFGAAAFQDRIFHAPLEEGIVTEILRADTGWGDTKVIEWDHLKMHGMPRSIAHPEYMFPDTTPVPDTIIVELGET